MLLFYKIFSSIDNSLYGALDDFTFINSKVFHKKELDYQRTEYVHAKLRGMSYQEMADKLDISRRAMAKAIAKLRSAGILRRIGPDKGGYWEIISTD